MCTREMRTAAGATTVTRWELDAQGHVVSREVGDGEAARRSAFHPTDGELPPGAAVTRSGRSVAVTGPGDHRVVWHYDERGLPVEREAGTGADRRGRYCAYDLAGRPSYRAARRGSRVVEERYWIWRGGALIALERIDEEGREARHRVVRRDGLTLVLSADGDTLERYEGDCGQLLYDDCSPIVAPAAALEGGAARVPSSRRVPRRLRSAPPTSRRARLFPARLFARTLTLSRLRAAFPGHAVITTVTFGENAPDYPIPMVCVEGGDEGCAVSIVHDESGRAVRAWSRSPRLSGPRGVRVGSRFEDIARQLDECTVVRGLQEGVRCRVLRAPGVEVWFEPMASVSDGERASAEMLEGRRVVALEWAADAAPVAP